MAVDIKVISININGVDTWFEYGGIIQELADKVDAFRRNYRDTLSAEKFSRECNSNCYNWCYKFTNST